MTTTTRSPSLDVKGKFESKIKARPGGCGKNGNSLNEAAEEKMRVEAVLRVQVPALHRKYRKLQEEACENRIKGNRCSAQMRMVHHLKQEKRDLLLLLHKMGKQEKSDDEFTKTMTRRRKMTAVDDMMNIYNSQSSLVHDCHSMLLEIGFYVDHILRTIWKHTLRIRKQFKNNNSFPTHEQIQTKLDRLENKLYFHAGKFSNVMTDIRNHRMDIDAKLSERYFFFKRVHRLKISNEWIKNQMDVIVSKANHCYNKYNDYRTQQFHLLKRNEFECQQFVNDLKDSVRFLKNDRYIRIFVDVKGKARIPLEMEGDREMRQLHEKWENVAKVTHRYRKAFQNIGDVSGLGVEGTRQLFIEKDVANFNLFRHITLLDDASHVLQNEIERIKDQIINVEKTYLHHRDNTLAQLQAEKKRNYYLSNAIVEIQYRLVESSETMDWLLNEMISLFKAIRCEESAVFVLLGNRNKYKELTPANLMTYLKVIEARIISLECKKETLSTLLSKKYLGAKNKTVLLGRLLNRKTKSRGGPFRPAIIISAGMTEGNAEDDDRLLSKRPLTYGEFKDICRELVDNSTKLIRALTNEDEGDAEEDAQHSAASELEPPLVDSKFFVI